MKILTQGAGQDGQGTCRVPDKEYRTKNGQGIGRVQHKRHAGLRLGTGRRYRAEYRTTDTQDTSKVLVDRYTGYKKEYKARDEQGNM